MKSTNNHKTLTALVVISAVAAVLTGSTVHMAFAQLGNIPSTTDPRQTQRSDFDQRGHIADKATGDVDQECKTAGGGSPIGTSCTSGLTNGATESGGVLNEKKSER